MIGRTTLLWLALAAFVVFGLFHVKYEVAALEEELGRLNAATLREQNQIHVLEAEWSYLNRPSRLEELAERYLELKPLAPEQLTTLSALPKRPQSAEGNDPAQIAKMLPPRKPPMLARAPGAGTPAAPQSPPTSRPQTAQPPAPTLPVGLALEGRR